MDSKKESLQVIVSYSSDGSKRESFNLYDELLLNEDFDSFLKNQAADYAFWANLRTEAQAVYDKRQIDFSVWYARAYDCIKADFDERGEKVTINVIENKLKHIFSSNFLLDKSNEEEITEYQEEALVRCKGSNPFTDFAFSSYEVWQKQLVEDKLYVEKLKVFEKAMDMRGSMLQTLCANKRQEEKLIGNSVITDEETKEEKRLAAFDQAAVRNTLMSRLNTKK